MRDDGSFPGHVGQVPVPDGDRALDAGGRPVDDILAKPLAWLESHTNLEAAPTGERHRPTLDRMRALASVLGEPQRAYPVIHLTGTNGKGSTARMVTALLNAAGLSVGLYTSPDLERINERIARNYGPISDDELAQVLTDLEALEPLLPMRPSRFDVLTAAAFRWFADLPVDVAVVEVGLGGRFDSTNVADAAVAVVTNVELDHTEVLGPTRAHIASEKAGIIKPSSTLVLGETDPELRAIFEREPAARTWTRGVDFGADASRVAVGGRLVDLRTPQANYPDIFVPLHGAHQADNAACALAAIEGFFGAPPSTEVVEAGFAAATSPGRMEVVGRQPLFLLDGAHNPAGARTAAATLNEEFSDRAGRILVIGLLQGHDADQMLEALEVERARLVVACSPYSPRAQPAEAVAAAARRAGVAAEVVPPVAAAVRHALARAEPEDLLLAAGSLYVVGAARTELVGNRHGGR